MEIQSTVLGEDDAPSSAATHEALPASRGPRPGSDPVLHDAPHPSHLPVSTSNFRETILLQVTANHALRCFPVMESLGRMRREESPGPDHLSSVANYYQQLDQGHPPHPDSLFTPQEVRDLSVLALQHQGVVTEETTHTDKQGSVLNSLGTVSSNQRLGDAPLVCCLLDLLFI